MNTISLKRGERQTRHQSQVEVKTRNTLSIQLCENLACGLGCAGRDAGGTTLRALPEPSSPSCLLVEQRACRRRPMWPRIAGAFGPAYACEEGWTDEI